ncbi:MAG: hypothetical protein M3Y07_12625 [Acidobacteriota bacterium]|nr:hypothetical protein [Acidobacteriota bacterium]
MLEPLRRLLAFAPQACTFGTAHLSHGLIQLARNMKAIEDVQSLAIWAAMTCR